MNSRFFAKKPDGSLVLHADLSQIATGQANDMVVAKDGTAYVGNFGFVASTRWASRAPPSWPAHRPQVRSASQRMRCGSRTGFAMTPDGKTLIVAEKLCHAADRLRRRFGRRAVQSAGLGRILARKVSGRQA